VGSSGWPFVFAVPGQMTHLVASDNINPEGFLSSTLLLVVIIVAVVITVILVVVIVGEGNPPMKTSMSFSEFGTIVGHKTANSWNLLIPRYRASLGPVLVLSVFAIVATCASRAAETLSATTFLSHGWCYRC
ncbi:hypothetical protein Tco_1542300, partial [Tanacetum coccineum]